MRVAYLLSLLAGVVFGVVSMLAGIERQRRRRARTPILNYPTVGAFLTALGLTGYLFTRYSSLGTLAIAVIAAIVALAAGGGMFALVAGWAVPSAARDVEDPRYRLQGAFGRVTRAIGPGEHAVGEISYQDDGVSVVTPARSLDGQRIDPGADIVIERIEDGVAYVDTWTRIERELKL